MKQCPNCTAPIDDNAEYCVYCGSKIEKAPCCPVCGSVIDPASKFCTSCGAKLEDTEQPQVSSVTPEESSSIPQDTLQEEIITNNSSEYIYEIEETFFQKNKNTIIIMAITLVVIVAIVLFSMFHGQTDENIGLSDTVDTAAVDTIPVYDESENLRADIMAKIEAIQPTDKTIWNLVITKDFTAPCINEDDELSNMDEHEFHKGDSYSEDYESYISKTEGGYYVDFGRNGKYFVPKENVSAKSYKITDFPKTILDLAGIRFKNKNGQYLNLFKLKRNDYTYRCYDNIVNKAVYCFMDDYNSLYEYEGKDKEYDSPCGYLMYAEDDSNNKSVVDKYGTLQCNIVAGSYNVPVYLFYVPSLKALMYHQDLFLLDEILIPEDL